MISRKLKSDGDFLRILNDFYRPLLVLNDKLKVQWGNRSYYEHFQTAPEVTEGVFLSCLGDGEWGISGLTDLLKEITSEHTDITDWEVARHFSKIGRRIMLLNAHQAGSHSDPGGRHILLSFEDITVRKKQEERMSRLAFTDELTGLNNRRSFLALTVDRLKLARRTGSDSCLFFADVDGLKKINDLHGHKEGDAALVDIAGVLKETFRECDIVARFSGDEFVILMSPASEDCEALIVERLKKNLKRFNSLESRFYKLALSMGSFYFHSGDQSTITEIMEKADEKLYELKKNRKIVFSGEVAPYLGNYSKDE